MSDYDLAIIGGGLNGTCIARDAAGRGLRVILIEQGDLGHAASSATPRLIHGDLAELERRHVWRVRATLKERATWMRIAPHLVRPQRFVIPVLAEARPPWLLRAGLLLYDRLAARPKLVGSSAVDLTHHAIGVPLKRPFGTAFDYSDCVVDDARLVVLNAVDAAERGADIRTGARCVRADRGAVWRLAVIDRGQRRVITARALVNSSGAWAASVAETVLRIPPPPAQIVKLSQIIVRRLFDDNHVYSLQNDDQRLIFVSPYERDFTLIGTVPGKFTGDPAIVSASGDEVAYLCRAANRYFRQQIGPSDVIQAIAGANSVPHPPEPFSYRGAITLDDERNRAPLLTILGGDLTGARLRAERAVAKLTPYYPMGSRWTADVPLPGGDFAVGGFAAQVDGATQRWPFLSEREAERLVACYGTRIVDVLGHAQVRSDLGPSFGELTGAEVCYLMDKEWARFPDDILWRRTKLGLSLAVADREALASFMARRTA